MVEKYYGFTLKQLIGFYLLIAVVGYSVIFYVPVTVQNENPVTLAEILFFQPDIIISQFPEPIEEMLIIKGDDGEMIASEPSAFCRIYPTFGVCRNG